MAAAGLALAAIARQATAPGFGVIVFKDLKQGSLHAGSRHRPACLMKAHFSGTELLHIMHSLMYTGF